MTRPDGTNEDAEARRKTAQRTFMNRRTFLQVGGTVGLATMAGCLDVLGEIDSSGVAQYIRRPEEPFFRGGLETIPEREFLAALLENQDEVDAVFSERPFFYHNEWWNGGGFVLLLQARFSPEKPFRFEWNPSTIQVGWRSARFQIQLVPIDSSDPYWEFVEDLRDADDLILTSWWWFQTQRVPKPRTATVELLAPDGSSRTTISTEDTLADA